jgi:hypothetical protein
MDYGLDASDFMMKNVYGIAELVARIRNDRRNRTLVVWSGFVLAYVYFGDVLYTSYHMAGIGTFLKSSGSI